MWFLLNYVFFSFFRISLNLKNYFLFRLKKKRLLSGFTYSATVDKHFTVNHDKTITMSLGDVL